MAADVTARAVLTETSSLHGIQTTDDGVTLAPTRAAEFDLIILSAADADGGTFIMGLGNADGATSTYHNIPISGEDSAVAAANKIANLAGGYGDWTATQGTAPDDHTVKFLATTSDTRLSPDFTPNDTGLSVQGLVYSEGYAGDRVLAAGQTAATERDFYIVKTGPWQRDTGTTLFYGMDIQVQEGLGYYLSRWTLTTEEPYGGYARDGSAPLHFEIVSKLPRRAIGVGLEETPSGEVRLPASGVAAGPYGTDARFTVDGLGIISGAQTLYGAETYIRGFIPSFYVDAGSTYLSISEGVCYVPATGQVEEFAGGDFIRGNGSTTRWIHVYLRGTSGLITFFDNTHPPAIYSGYAATKGGAEASEDYRHLFSITEVTGRVPYRITAQGDGNNPLIRYLTSTIAAPFRVLSGGVATAETSVSCAAVVPPTSREAVAQIINTSNQIAYFGVEGDDITGGAGVAQGIIAVTAGHSREARVPLNASQAFTYWFATAPTSGGLFVDVLGYRDRR